MSAVREQILVTVLAKLQSIASPAGVKIYRNKTTEVDAYPSLVLLDGGHEVLSDQTQFPRYRMSVGVQGYVRSKSEDLIGGLINELYVAVAVALTSDVTQGNLAIDTREEGMAVEINQDPDDQVTAAFDLGFSIEFATRYGNPAQLAP